jgi:hypothetical protein
MILPVINMGSPPTTRSTEFVIRMAHFLLLKILDVSNPKMKIDESRKNSPKKNMTCVLSLFVISNIVSNNSVERKISG